MRSDGDLYRTNYIIQEIELLDKEDYLSILRSVDIKSGLSKIINKKIGEYLYGYVEDKKEIEIDELIRTIEIYYIRQLDALTSYFNKYTKIIEHLIDAYNIFSYLSCIIYGEKPCIFYFGSGLYSLWIMNGTEALNKALESKKECHHLFSIMREKKRLDYSTFLFCLKPLWEAINVYSSFPARKVLGLLYDFLILRLALIYEISEQEIITSYLRKEMISAVLRGLREERHDLFHILDEFLEGFSSLYFEISKIAGKIPALDISFLIYLTHLSSDLIEDLDEINLRKYLMILRECFLLKLVLLVMHSGTNIDELYNILSRRL